MAWSVAYVGMLAGGHARLVRHMVVSAFRAFSAAGSRPARRAQTPSWSLPRRGSVACGRCPPAPPVPAVTTAPGKPRERTGLMVHRPGPDRPDGPSTRSRPGPEHRVHVTAQTSGAEEYDGTRPKACGRPFRARLRVAAAAPSAPAKRPRRLRPSGPVGSGQAAPSAPAKRPRRLRTKMSDPPGTFEQTSNSDWTFDRI
jgi:hypothetical protein